MKKNHYGLISGVCKIWKSKFLKRMRIVALLILISITQTFALDAYSQTKRLSLDINNETIINILDKIEDQSEFYFMFDASRINVDQRKSVNCENQPIRNILDQLFENTGITYSINDRQILLTTTDKFDSEQQKTVSGKVIDSSGSSLPGVTVVVKGTTNGAITDADGNYSLANVPNDATLVFSFVGMKTQEMSVTGKNQINVTMVEETIGIEEVVAVGYGTMRKSDLTGSVIRARIDNFKEVPNVNIAQSLHGSVSGLTVGQVDEAGETPSIEIRGRNTLNGNTAVLIVLDDIIYSGQLSDINPSDIQSIDILKDASSKAIYGANAANGVILIKSKHGKKSSKPVFNYNGSYTTQNPTSKLTLQNRDQNIQRIYDAAWKKVNQAPDYTTLIPGIKIEDTGVFQNVLNMINEGHDYDWWENATNPSFTTTHNLNVQGNKDDFSYFISGGYTKEKGFIINDEFERYSLRINLSSKIFDWFEIGTQTFGSFSDYSGSSPDLNQIRIMAPFTVPYDENGELIINPMGDINSNPFIPSSANDFDKRNNLSSNFFTSIDFPFLKGLNYKLNFGNNYAWDRHYYSSEYLGQTKAGQAYKYNSSLYDYTVDNILNYIRTFNMQHRINLTLLYGIRELNYENTNANANTFSSIRLGYNDLSLGSVKQINSDAWKESYSYQMARLNYDYKSKYLITATIRRDGFSGFAKNNKIALFPSLGLGWALNEEKFFNFNCIDQLKLRASYGINGNLTNRYSSLAAINQYPAYIFGDNGSTEYGQEVKTLGNSNLSWEKTSGYNLGVDFSLWKSRLSGSIEYYQSTTEDLLYDVNIPLITGFSSIKSNLGEIANRGFELQLSSNVIHTSNFDWHIDLNLSSNKNEIKHLIGLDADNDGIEDDLIASNLFIGEPIGAVYSYVSDGIIQIGDDVPEGFNIGTHRILDKNNDEIIDPNDRIIIGHTEPAYQFGIMNELKYKDFTFKFFVNSVQGGKNGYLGSMATPSEWSDFDNSVRLNFYNIDYWTPNNPSAKYDVPGTTSKIYYQYYESRSFIRLQDIVLAYNINSKLIKKIGLQSGKVFLSGKNLITLTNWKGWDPETGAGIQRTARPVLKGVSMGIDFSF